MAEGEFTQIKDKDGNPITYYEALGVSNTATYDEIKKERKIIVLKNHSDKNVGSDKSSAERLNNITANKHCVWHVKWRRGKKKIR